MIRHLEPLFDAPQCQRPIVERCVELVGEDRAEPAGEFAVERRRRVEPLDLGVGDQALGVLVDGRELIEFQPVADDQFGRPQDSRSPSGGACRSAPGGRPPAAAPMVSHRENGGGRGRTFGGPDHSPIVPTTGPAPRPLPAPA